MTEDIRGVRVSLPPHRDDVDAEQERILPKKVEDIVDPDVITSQMVIVLVVSWLGWMLDILDSALYQMIQTSCLEDLLGTTDKSEVNVTAGIILSVFLIGAAVGGICVGTLSDIFGRAAMMMVTVFLYSIASGLSALCTNWVQLCILRFFAGIGTGGEWACGAALVAEVWPNKYRCYVGPILQSGGAIGALVAGVLYFHLSDMGWRSIFLVGLIPAFLALVLRCFVDESEMWKASRDAKIKSKQTNDDSKLMANLFMGPMLQDTMSLSITQMSLLFVFWGTAAWFPAIMIDFTRDYATDEWLALGEEKIASYMVISLNIGSLIGALSWIYTADGLGRKPTLSMFICLQMIALPVIFSQCNTIESMLACAPVVGFAAGGVFGGMPIILTETFPTYVRGTGTAFTYNFGRIFAALAPLLFGYMVAVMGTLYYAAAIVPVMGFVGLMALLFVRETRGVKLE